MPRDARETHAIQRCWEITPGVVSELGIRVKGAQCVHDRASLGCVILSIAGNHRPPPPLLKLCALDFAERVPEFVLRRAAE